ncbi:3-dehydroquinate synthase [Flavobacterium sp. J49]|uniref:3-dehydroquinate synthase n=1 Tax=Flavobacterium sp. J49 TaxID=2718534 RepID=UPI001592E560|nr:3-dehydroquinate synthase [Flavobacterium sp. J49]MBF6640452.1 3-dehydroquinate synthase [Flavobacterium sp. J49]NIC01699.1 3-dehydroquinate synthase [Flavobacterium sp. J49]
MQTIQANGYPVLFGEKEYETLNSFIAKNNYSNLFILVDSHTNELCLLRFLSFLATDKTIEIIEIESGEAEKNITTCVEIWNILTELGADRKTLLINIGGGVITDIGGFVASTFKRGIDFVNIPTTLLAMVDASIGGKNGVDLGNLKNQIGVINVPKTVLIDTEFLVTLPQKEMRSGLAEMLKHGLIFDAAYWAQFKDLSQTDFADFDGLIHRSIEIKNEIVMQDPTENGIRKALNFGHTLGHAIESYFLENENKKTLLHGEAIAVGMVLESYISWQKGLLSEAEYREIKKTIKSVFDTVVFEENDLQPILDLLIHDKKNEYGKIQFALLEGIGKIKINQEVDNELITKSFEDYKN